MREGQMKPREVPGNPGNNPGTPGNLKVPGKSREVPGKTRKVQGSHPSGPESVRTHEGRPQEVHGSAREV
jgi:hypothetical protein